jgi:hypothetical protein
MVSATMGASALTGLGILRVLRLRWLLRPRLENLLAWIFLGLGWWILGYGWLNYLRFSARQLRWPLLVSGLAWSVVGIWKGRADLYALSRCLRRRPAASAVFGVACLLSLMGILTRVTAFQWIYPFNDNLTYASLATHLQEHHFPAFSHAIPEVEQTPSPGWYARYEAQHEFRMGATWLLALLQALTGRDPLVISQVLMGIGIVLNLCAIHLLACWGVRLGWRPIAGIVLFASALGSPLQAAAYFGFQGQCFGTAYFVFVLALLSRCLDPARWTVGTAAVVALATTTFVSVYSDMAPLLALVALGTLVFLCRRARRAGLGRRLAGFALLTAAFLLGLGNVEWLRAYDALRVLVGFVCGWKISWTWMGYLEFALGIAPPGYTPQTSSLGITAIVLLSLLALAGGICLVRRRNWVILQALAILAVMTAFFSFARDPYTAEIGHRWSLFKLAGWGYPVLVLLPFVGLAWLRPRWLSPLVFFVPGMMLAIAGLAGQQPQDNVRLVKLLGTRRPESKRRDLQAYLAEGGFDSVCLVDQGIDSPHLPCLASYLVHPWPTRHGWFGGGLSSAGDQDPDFDLGENTLVITWSDPPFEVPQERLPLNLIRLDVSRPHIFSLENPAGPILPHPDGGKWAALSEQPANLHLWTPRATQAVLVLRFDPSSTCNGPWRVHLREERTGLDQTLPIRGRSQVAHLLTLPAGRSRVELSCRGPVTRHPSPLTLRHAELRFASDSQPAIVTRR